jgi:predicted metal-dependent phosphoesterase TrpH
MFNSRAQACLRTPNFWDLNIDREDALVAVDLHVHSNLSDGSLSVPNLVWQAQRAGLKTISITDHESIDSFGYIKTGPLGVEIIPGVELKTIYEDSTIEILGYDIKPTQSFSTLLRGITTSRIQRMRRILPRVNEYLLDCGSRLSISEQELRDICPNSNFHTSHIAGLIQSFVLGSNGLEKERIGIPPDTLDIRTYLIANWFKAGGLFYEPHQVGLFPSLVRAMDMIRDMEGKVVLAHPGKLEDECIDKLDMDMFDGIEVFYGGHSLTQVDRFSLMAESKALKPTAGSDFHGDFTPNIKLGSQPSEWCTDL